MLVLCARGRRAGLLAESGRGARSERRRRTGVAADAAGSLSSQAVRLLPVSHPIAKQFAELCAQAESQSGLLVRCEMLELVGKTFARDLAPTGKAEAATLSATKRIRVLLEHLTEEEFLNASSDELAAYCGCSPRHFSRLFLQHFGVSLRSRQTEMRLLKARRLLVETDSRVRNVAAACGYRHLGVFNALFKKPAEGGAGLKSAAAR